VLAFINGFAILVVVGKQFGESPSGVGDASVVWFVVLFATGQELAIPADGLLEHRGRLWLSTVVMGQGRPANGEVL